MTPNTRDRDELREALDELVTLREKATPGPWVSQSPDDRRYWVDSHHDPNGPSFVTGLSGSDHGEPDAAFIAAVGSFPFADLRAALNAVPPEPPPTTEAALAEDARRYRRLQVLGAAPGGSRQLDNGTVLRFTGLDAFVDADLARMPTRGEAHPVAVPTEPSPTIEAALTDGIAYAIARAPVPAKADTARVVAARLAPLVIESGYLTPSSPDRLRDAAQALLVPIDHGRVSAPNPLHTSPGHDCDECYRIRAERYDELRDALRAESPVPPEPLDGLDVEGVMGWLRRSDGRLEDIFGLWVQGKRDERWVAEHLIGEGHLDALRADR